MQKTATSYRCRFLLPPTDKKANFAVGSVVLAVVRSDYSLFPVILHTKISVPASVDPGACKVSLSYQESFNFKVDLR